MHDENMETYYIVVMTINLVFCHEKLSYIALIMHLGFCQFHEVHFKADFKYWHLWQRKKQKRSE